MVTLRSTRDLLKLLGVKAEETVSEPAAALGDWCARPVSTQAGDFIICISDVTYLSILVAALLYRDLTSFFLMRLAQFLADLGVSEAQAQRECACYQNILTTGTILHSHQSKKCQFMTVVSISPLRRSTTDSGPG